MRKSGAMREICNNKHLHHQTGKISLKKPDFTPQRYRKQEESNSKVSRRKRTVNIRAEKIKERIFKNQ